jgi:hypothetical protein
MSHTNLFTYLSGRHRPNQQTLDEIYKILAEKNMPALDQSLVLSANASISDSIIPKYELVLKSIAGVEQNGQFSITSPPSQVNSVNTLRMPPTLSPLSAITIPTQGYSAIRPSSQQVKQPRPKLDLIAITPQGAKFKVSKKDLLNMIDWPNFFAITGLKDAIDEAANQLDEDIKPPPYLSFKDIDDPFFNQLIAKATQQILEDPSIKNQDSRCQKLFSFLIEEAATRAKNAQNQFYQSSIGSFSSIYFAGTKNQKYTQILRNFANNMRQIPHQNHFALHDFKLEKDDKSLYDNSCLAILLKKVHDYYLLQRQCNASQITLEEVVLLEAYVCTEPLFWQINASNNGRKFTEINELIATLNLAIFADLLEKTFAERETADFSFMSSQEKERSIRYFYNASDRPEDVFQKILTESEILIFLSALAKI